MSEIHKGDGDDPMPIPSDGPEYWADLAAWQERQVSKGWRRGEHIFDLEDGYCQRHRRYCNMGGAAF